MVIVPNEWVNKARLWSLVAMLVVLAGGGYVIGMVVMVEPLKPSPLEQEA